MRNDNNQLPLHFLSVLSISLSLCVLTAYLSSRVCAMLKEHLSGFGHICRCQRSLLGERVYLKVHFTQKSVRSKICHHSLILTFSNIHATHLHLLNQKGEVLQNVHAALFLTSKVDDDQKLSKLKKFHHKILILKSHFHFQFTLIV